MDLVVVGAGPAGMEAARVAALRGHRVTLLERSDRLGGTLFFAGLAYAENARLLDNLKVQVQQSSIDIRLNTQASPALLRDLGADQVLVAVADRLRASVRPGDTVARLGGDEFAIACPGAGSDDDEIVGHCLSFSQFL